MTEGRVTVAAQGLRKTFAAPTGGRVVAVNDITLQIHAGQLTALVGPDGAGKTTLLRMVAGLLTPDAGTLHVLDTDVVAEPQSVQDRVSYMPQRFGLYEDLSVQENLDLYADLHGVPPNIRRKRFERLLAMTALGRFTARPAGKLSGGMKQKLGLACTLVRAPELLLLDEPSVGVDPLSRRDLWQILQQLIDEEHLSVVVSTAYMDEAERCAQVLVINQGLVLADGPPQRLKDRARGLTFLASPPAGVAARDLQARLIDADDRIIDAVPKGGGVRFIVHPGVNDHAIDAVLQDAQAQPRPHELEDAFMMMLKAHASASRPQEPKAPGIAATAAQPVARTRASEQDAGKHTPVIVVRDLVRKFGDFTAVASTSFDVKRGEIFGLLGPNGAGKTTTFRMLCGLLPATSGHLEVAGVDLRSGRAQARQRIGYVSQKFALYGNLSVRENLEFFAGAYGLRGQALRQRVEAVLSQFELEADARSGELPNGYKQRLAMAASLLHEPEILFLDEPTSGIDPLARRAFWRTITGLAQGGVTIIVTTHFMEEAEYCDRIAIQDAGRMLAIGTPQQVRDQAGGDHGTDMNDAFIAIVEQGRQHSDASQARTQTAVSEPHPEAQPAAGKRSVSTLDSARTEAAHGGFRRRFSALLRKETRQMLRDRSNLAVGLLLPVMLILLFGYGLSFDVTDVPLAVVMEDSSPTARDVVAGLNGSPYLSPVWMTSVEEAEQRMRQGQVNAILRVPSDFSRQLAASHATLQLVLNGVDSNTAAAVEGYVGGAVGQWAQLQAARSGVKAVGAAGGIELVPRMWFNEASTSTWYLVPGLIVLVMTLIGAFLTSLLIAREWERGTLESLFVTPVRPLEIVLAKLVPYMIVGAIDLVMCLLAARFLFEVPLRGSLVVIVVASMLYLTVALLLGLFISGKTRNQFEASQIAMLASFMPAMMLSGFVFDLRNVPGVVQVVSQLLPATHFMGLIKTLFLAGDNWRMIVRDCSILVVYATVLLLATRRMLRKTLE